MASSSAEHGRPRILMACYFDWDAPLHIGSHHIATGFVRAGWDVAYVSNAISPLHALRDWQDFCGRVRRYRPHGSWHLDRHLWSYTPVALLTPHNAVLLRGGYLHRNWHRFTIPNVVKAVASHGFGDVDVLYVDAPIQSYWLDAASYRVSVVRVTDRNAGFAGSARELQVLECEMLQRADLVAYSATSLAQDVSRAGARDALHLPNGVDFQHFAAGDRSVPPDYDEIPRPIVAYVGAIDKWFDFDGVAQAARALPGVSFVLIGPPQIARARLGKHPNIHVLGSRPFDQLPRYLHNADAAMIPFDVRGHADLVHAIHPLKLYEYLACGLPVVASRWDELERLGSPAILYDDAAGLVTSLRLALGTPPDSHSAVAFAREADWSDRVETLLNALGMSAR